MQAENSVDHISIEAVVIRADGTREDLGTIAEWDKADDKFINRLRRGVLDVTSHIRTGRTMGRITKGF